MKLRWLNAYLSELRPFEGLAEIPIGFRVICQNAMAYGYIVIRYEGIVIVSDLAVLHMKFDALNDFLMGDTSFHVGVAKYVAHGTNDEI